MTTENIPKKLRSLVNRTKNKFHFLTTFEAHNLGTHFQSDLKAKGKNRLKTSISRIMY